MNIIPISSSFTFPMLIIKHGIIIVHVQNKMCKKFFIMNKLSSDLLTCFLSFSFVDVFQDVAKTAILTNILDVVYLLFFSLLSRFFVDFIKKLIKRKNSNKNDN